MGTTVGQQLGNSEGSRASIERRHGDSEFDDYKRSRVGHDLVGRQPLVLVADDEPLVRQLICSILTRHGWRTVEASDGVEALGLSIDEKFDLLITDYEMPTISGLQLANAVRRRTPDVPILMISGYPACVIVARDHGFMFLQKPFEAEDLLRHAEAVTDMKTGDRAVGSTSETRSRLTDATAR
jgi:CheY-like chemotaxis protein